MKKILFLIFSIILFSTSLIGMEYEDSNLSSWRDGFITAYKAMKMDTKIQGVESKIIPTKKYVIYFDTNKSDIADWDKVMVQMFGYSLSLNKPIRSKDGFIIFDSYDNKATATQEMELLNKKIFKGSEKYSLSLYENLSNKVFYSDTALLMEELDGLKNLMVSTNKINLEKKKKELEENQKVALVYVDDKTEKIINNIGDIVETDLSTNKRTIIKTDMGNRREGSSSNEIFYGIPTKNSISVFSKPNWSPAYKVGEVSKEIIEFDAKDSHGWYKIKNKELYVANYLITIVPKPKELVKEISLKTLENNIVSKNIETKEKNNITKGNIVPSSKIIEDEKNKPIKKEFVITSNNVIIYSLKNFEDTKSIYNLDDFVTVKTMENDGNRNEYSHIVYDTDNNKFIKLKNKNSFIDFKDVYIIK